MENEHIVKKFDANLENIKATIVDMGRLVGLQVNDATAVLTAYDKAEVDRITAYDRIINGLNKDVHDRAEILIVRRQPVALDLRQTLAPINISGELERIGDHAKSTAKRAHIIHNSPTEDTVLDLIAQMSANVQSMLEDVIIAYANADIDLAAHIRSQDKDVDAIYKTVVQTVIETLSKTPDNAESLIHITLIARNFERIGDHICNIARYVHQIVTGHDLKASAAPSERQQDT